MRLVTHNMLRCNAKGVENGYPLLIEATGVAVVESEFDAAAVSSLLGKLNFGALKSAAENLSMSECLGGAEAPLPEALLESGEFLRAVHRLLFEVHVLEGMLVCPESGRKFPIREGIPNMLLHEDEI